MGPITSVAELTALGRVRLSEHFFMRDMLYSEVANFHGLQNIPVDPDLAVQAGAALCETLLEPLHRAFGAVVVRSAYRSPSVNDFCFRQRKPGGTDYFCSGNDFNAARHIWDLRDAEGYLGATASIVIPWYLPRFEASGDFRPLAWWIRDNLPGYAEASFYPWLCAFNIRWYEGPNEGAITFHDGQEGGTLTKAGMENFGGDHSALYPGFPQPA